MLLHQVDSFDQNGKLVEPGGIIGAAVTIGRPTPGQFPRVFPTGPVVESGHVCPDLHGRKS